MSTTSGDTNLVNTEDNTKVIETLPTLAGGYTDSTFVVNKWGYKKNRNTDNYNSFPSTQTLLENDERTNEDIANLRFGTKIDYLQESGTYATNIEFNLVANPLVDYMQNFTKAMCEEKASDADYVVIDKRDGQEYTVRWLANNCWMTQNLGLAAETTITKTDSNISADSYVLPIDSTTGYNTDTIARMHCSETPYIGCWYNYVATTANTITGTSTAEAQYDICPAGWRLSSYDEQSTLVSLITNPNDFKPLSTGFYYANTYYDGSGNPTHWWSSTATSSGTRRNIYRVPANTNLMLVSNSSVYGFNIRCIAK